MALQWWPAPSRRSEYKSRGVVVAPSTSAHPRRHAGPPHPLPWRHIGADGGHHLCQSHKICYPKPPRPWIRCHKPPSVFLRLSHAYRRSIPEVRYSVHPLIPFCIHLYSIPHITWLGIPYSIVSKTWRRTYIVSILFVWVDDLLAFLLHHVYLIFQFSCQLANKHFSRFSLCLICNVCSHIGICHFFLTYANNIHILMV